MAITFREQMRGFPVWQMVVISLIRFLEPIAFTLMFPYVYFMIRDFGVADTEADIATYSGYLSGLFAFFQFLCSVQWGAASDRWGRKPILLVGLFGTAALLLMFGFSPSFTAALVARLIMGSLNGNIAVLRTAIGEIAVEKRHQAIAFATLPLLWNFGSIIGPMVGGSKYLTRPRGLEVDFTGPKWYEDFVTKYPYALSNIFVLSLLMVSWIVAFLFLEETHPKCRSRRDVGLEMGNWIRRKLGFVGGPILLAPAPCDDDTELTMSEYSSLLAYPRRPYALVVADEDDFDEVFDDDASIELVGPVLRRYSVALLRRESSHQLHPVLLRLSTQEGRLLVWASFNEIFTQGVSQTLMANFLLSFHLIVFSEFLPVFLAATFMPDQLQFPWKIRGGFGYDSSTIGTLLLSTGLIGGLNILIVFPWLDRKFSTKRNYAAASLVFPLLYFAIPFLIFTLPEYDSRFPEGFTKVALYALAFVNVFGVSLSFPNLLMLIHQALPARHRAFINGTALSLSSLARCLGPMIWGYLMTTVEKAGVAEVSWFILAFVSVVVAIQAFSLTDNEDQEDDDA